MIGEGTICTSPLQRIEVSLFDMIVSRDANVERPISDLRVHLQMHSYKFFGRFAHRLYWGRFQRKMIPVHYQCCHCHAGSGTAADTLQPCSQAQDCGSFNGVTPQANICWGTTTIVQLSRGLRLFQSRDTTAILVLYTAVKRNDNNRVKLEEGYTILRI